MKVVISNFGKEHFPDTPVDYARQWQGFSRPPQPPRHELFDLEHNWGFHIFSIGVYLLDHGLADEVEFWNFEKERRFFWHRYGFFWMNFQNEPDLAAYLEQSAAPDLYIQHGSVTGRSVLQMLENRSFRVYIPALRIGNDVEENADAECYLVDDPEFLDERSMMYIPVVNTKHVKPSDTEKRFDFIYLAEARASKRHDIVIEAARKNGMKGHFHPVEPGQLDVKGTQISCTGFDTADPVELMQASRIAVYPGSDESSPAAMWEATACDLPIVVNDQIAGGRHVVVPGVTGELSAPDAFAEVMRYTLSNRDRYRPRDWLLKHWDTERTLEAYLAFFRKMGWKG